MSRVYTLPVPGTDGGKIRITADSLEEAEYLAGEASNDVIVRAMSADRLGLIQDEVDAQFGLPVSQRTRGGAAMRRRVREIFRGVRQGMLEFDAPDAETQRRIQEIAETDALDEEAFKVMDELGPGLEDVLYYAPDMAAFLLTRGWISQGLLGAALGAFGDVKQEGEGGRIGGGILGGAGALAFGQAARLLQLGNRAAHSIAGWSKNLGKGIRAHFRSAPRPSGVTGGNGAKVVEQALDLMDSPSPQQVKLGQIALQRFNAIADKNPQNYIKNEALWGIIRKAGKESIEEVGEQGTRVINPRRFLANLDDTVKVITGKGKDKAVRLVSPGEARVINRAVTEPLAGELKAFKDLMGKLVEVDRVLTPRQLARVVRVLTESPEKGQALIKAITKAADPTVVDKLLSTMTTLAQHGPTIAAATERQVESAIAAGAGEGMVAESELANMLSTWTADQYQRLFSE